MTFGRELVVLLTKSSMFGKFLVHVLEVVWRFEPITFYIGSFRVKLILAPIEFAKIYHYDRFAYFFLRRKIIAYTTSVSCTQSSPAC